MLQRLSYRIKTIDAQALPHQNRQIQLLPLPTHSNNTASYTPLIPLYMNVYIYALLCHNKVVGSQPRSPQSGHRPCTDDLVKRTGLQLHVYMYLWEGRLRWEIYHLIIPLRAIHIIRYTCMYKLYNYVTFPKHIMYSTITHKM